MKYSELEPKKLFSYFKQLSDIPRGSGNERAAAEFVRDTAIRLGHEAAIDGSDNVFVRAKATPGYEDHAPVMLQAHLDMVCEANRGTKHDFLRDPIELILTGDELRANGTTLGADDGFGVATMLAILDSDAPHPALECLFTTDEENGLTGMHEFDAAQVRSRRLINLDNAAEGEATVSCAGGVRSHITFDAETEALPDGFTAFSLEISGLAGGHSGEDIHLGRKNALSTLARILYAVRKVTETRIVSLSGGNRDNAIPRECTAVFAVSDAAKARAAVEAQKEKLYAEIVPDDSGMKIDLTPADAKKVLTAEKSDALLSLLRNLPNGIQGMSRTIPGLVETSSNLAVVRETESGFEIVLSSRSSVESLLDDMEDRMECAALAVGAKIGHFSRYPGWDYLEGSPMQELYLSTWKEVFGTDARVVGIHAGLECGILKAKLPEMDMISIGPDIRNLHSPDEVMKVSSFSRMYELVCAMLKKA